MEPRPTSGTPARPPAKPRPAESDSEEDVEIELELPQHKIDELLRQLEDQNSSLKSEFPLAHVAAVRNSSIQGWDPLAKLAQFKELQARYAQVKEQRERAESTQRILQQMPTAGTQSPVKSMPAPPGGVTPPDFPPREGLPFPFCGVPGVLSPRARAPPEREPDYTEGDEAYKAVREIRREEGPQIQTRMSKEEVLLAKDGMDMALNHLRTTGARMKSEVRELDRKMEEAENLAEIRHMASGDVQLMDELLGRQRLIHEQQRLADEVRMDLEVEKERAFWLRREKVMQPEEVDDFKLEGDPVEYPPAEEELLGTSRATTGSYPAMRHMTPELIPQGGGPQSRYRMELPASREYHQRVAHQAAQLGWPSPAEALRKAPSPERLEGPAPRGARGARGARGERGERSERSPPEPEPSPRSPPETPKNFFAGFAERGELEEIWEPVDARGRPLKSREQRERAAPAAREVPTLQGAPPFAAFAGEGAVDFFGSSDQELTRSPRGAPEESDLEEEAEYEEEEAEEQGYFGGIFGGEERKKAPVDPSARYMAGACLVRSPPLQVPDFKAEDQEALLAAKQLLLRRREAGRLGETASAQLALDYAWAVARGARRLAEQDEAWEHVGILTDVLHFFPNCGPMHLWVLEALMSLLRHEESQRANGLARPIFDSVTDLISLHLEDPTLCSAVPELPRRLLAALALAITPDSVKRLTQMHVDFALALMKEPEASPLTTEHGLQIVVLSASQRNLRAQADAARSALRCFRAEPRLVPRALLALGTIYAIATQGQESGILVKEATASDELAQGEHLVPVGFREITTTMDVYAKDRKVQGAGCRALESALDASGASIEALVRDGLLRSLSLAHQRFPQSHSVALSVCRVIGKVALKHAELLKPEVGITCLSCGASLPRDAEVVVACLEAIYVMAPSLRSLWSTASNVNDRLAMVASDLVRLGEVRHKDEHSVGMLLVILTCLASDGHGTAPGGLVGERWRQALGRAAAAAVPLRVLYEHGENVDMVTAAGIALRCLSYGSEETCKHVARARACPILLSTLTTYSERPATVRELLAALANCASMKSIKEDFQQGLPATAEVIYRAMEQSADQDPDVLAQGCRAFGSLYAIANTEVNLGLQPGEKMKISSNVQWSKLNNAIMKTVIGITVHSGEAVDGLDLLGNRRQRLEDTRRRLGELCTHLASGTLAAGPQFGRLLSLEGEPTAECTPRWNSLRTRLQERERRKPQAPP